MFGVVDELLLRRDSAEKGDDFNSCLRTDGELAAGAALPNPNGCDIPLSLFIEGPIRLILDAAEDRGLASKADSFFKFRSPVLVV